MADAGVPLHHLRTIAGHGSLITAQALARRALDRVAGERTWRSRRRLQVGLPAALGAVVRGTEAVKRPLTVCFKSRSKRIGSLGAIVW
jgi:hypothetical protein